VSKSKKKIIKKLAKKKNSCQEIVKKEKKKKLSENCQKVKKCFLGLRQTALLSAEGKQFASTLLVFYVTSL
jgi:hypothetical protein